MSLKEFKDKFNAKFGKEIMVDGLGILAVPRFSSGSLALDIDAGGGLPHGRTMEYFGPESSGKTTIALYAAAQITKAGGRVQFIDDEGTLDRKWAEKIGVDFNNVLVSYSEYGEQSLDILEYSVQSGEFDLVVLDSIAALSPKVELEGGMEDNQMGLLARLMGKVHRKLYKAHAECKRIKPEGTTVILLNQMRIKLGISYGNPETVPGGNATKYACSIRLDLRKSEVLKDEGDNVYGQKTKYTFVKNKIAPPFKTGDFNLYIDGDKAGQIDNISSLVDFGILTGKINKGGSWYTSSWIDGKVQGYTGLVEKMRAKGVDDLNNCVQELEAIYGHDIQFRF